MNNDNNKWKILCMHSSHKVTHKRVRDRERKKDSVSANTLFGWFIDCIFWIAVVASFPPASTFIAACAQNELTILPERSSYFITKFFFYYFSLVYDSAGSIVRFISFSKSLFGFIIIFCKISRDSFGCFLIGVFSIYLEKKWVFKFRSVENEEKTESSHWTTCRVVIKTDFWIWMYGCMDLTTLTKDDKKKQTKCKTTPKVIKCKRDNSSCFIFTPKQLYFYLKENKKS